MKELVAGIGNTRDTTESSSSRQDPSSKGTDGVKGTSKFKLTFTDVKTLSNIKKNSNIQILTTDVSSILIPNSFSGFSVHSVLPLARAQNEILAFFSNRQIEFITIHMY